MDDRRGTGLLTALLLGALLAPGVQAQESQGTLAGRVLTEERGVPVAGVQIRFRAGPSVLTGRDGSYRLSDVPTGMQDFVLVTSRCEFAFGSARAGLDGDWTVNLSLPEAMARGHRARETETQGLVLTTQDLSSPPAPSLADALRREVPEMVIGLPGQAGRVARVEGRTRATAQGATTPLFVLDGVRLGNDPSILWDLRPEDVDRVEVLPGAVGGWTYGTDASGGVVRIETRKGSGVSGGAPESCRIPPWPGHGGSP